MPYTDPFSEQKNQWFSILIFIGLPFFILWRLFKNELPDLRETRPRKK